MAETEDMALLRDAARVHAVGTQIRQLAAQLEDTPFDETTADELVEALIERCPAARTSLERIKQLTVRPSGHASLTVLDGGRTAGSM